MKVWVRVEIEGIAFGDATEEDVLQHILWALAEEGYVVRRVRSEEKKEGDEI